MKTLIPCLVSAVALLFAVPARSADTEKTPQEIENLAKELVPKLGDPDFREREAASRELVKLGPGALKALNEGCRSPDPEIRARCLELVPKIRALDLKRRIEELANDTDGRITNTFPLFATYMKICGKDENARKFYIELYKSQRQLLDAADKDPNAMGEAFNKLTKEIEQNGKGAFSPVMQGAALLLIGADEKIGPSIDDANRKQPKGGDRNYQRLIGLLWTPKYEALMTDPNGGRYFRKLLFAWAKRLPEPLAMRSFLFFIQDMDKKKVMNLQSDSDALEFLRHLATSKTEQRLPDAKAMAIDMLAKSSRNDQMSYFEEYILTDETTLQADVLFDPPGTTKITVKTRTCDYALAICVKRSGQSFTDYGFDILGQRSDLFVCWQFAGFSQDETRKAAFKKYEEWRKANPIPKGEPK